MPIAQINNKLVLFIHVPKTGGSSIKKHLAAHGPLSFDGGIGPKTFPCLSSHFHGALLMDLFSNTAFDWSFMVVRHPVKRLLSQYRYQTRKPNPIRNNLPFSVWLRYVFLRRRMNPYYRDNHFRPQHEFEAFDSKVFRLEDGLKAPIEHFNKLAGVEECALVPWANKTALKEVKVTAEDKALIFKTYKEDFLRYGYEI